MPSLQANHSRSCALGRAWTPFDEARVGCTCPDGPFYYVVVRAGQHAHKEAVGRDRHQAEIALRRVAAAVDDGSFRPRPTIGFLEWADRWLASLERKPTTVGSYRSTIAHAKDVFGSQRVRRIAPGTQHYGLRIHETRQVIDMPVGIIAGDAVSQPDHVPSAQVIGKRAFDLEPPELGIASLHRTEQAFFCREQ